MKSEYRRELSRHVTGAVLLAALTLLAFWVVMTDALPKTGTLWTITATAIIQIVVQLRFFLHIGWNQRREDLHLILFSLLLTGR